MIGVLVLAVGLPRMFASIEHGQHLDNSVMVLGYVIMRVAMVFQWLRAAKQDPARRRACFTYAIVISIAQLGWAVLIFVDFSLSVTFILICALALIEMAGPFIAEHKDGGTPGTPITSRSAIACSPSLRWARGLWARSRPCRP